MDIREELPASPSASALARRALDGWLSDLVGVDTADAARVAASELVANAVQHGGLEPDDTISLVGSATDEVVRVGLEQASSVGDVRLIPIGERDPRDGGIGLRIVDASATNWGVDPGPPGVVWFEVDRDKP